jgi:hypothetical protein
VTVGIEYRESSVWDANTIVDESKEISDSLEIPDSMLALEFFKLFFGPPLPSLYLTYHVEAIVKRKLKLGVKA